MSVFVHSSDFKTSDHVAAVLAKVCVKKAEQLMLNPSLKLQQQIKMQTLIVTLPRRGVIFGSSDTAGDVLLSYC